MNSKDFLDFVFEKAKKNIKRIGFSEPEDIRILDACIKLKKEAVIEPVLIGDKSKALKIAKDHKLDISSLEFIEPDNRYVDTFLEYRKGKIRKEDALQLSMQSNYFATLLLNDNKIDGIVSGAVMSTAETFRPALQIIKSDGFASTFFVMITKSKTYFFADCALNMKPSANELAQIAIDTAKSAKLFGFKPKVAMLSFSTNNSASHDDVLLVREATQIVKNKEPKLDIEGEIQVDVALNEAVARHKFKDSKIKGDANILVFPDLNSGNIGYKLVERLAGALAIGPISQGFKKPVNDLSRGCSVQDIILVSAICAIQANK